MARAKTFWVLLAIVMGTCGLGGISLVTVLVYRIWSEVEPQELPYAKGFDLDQERSRYRTQLLKEGPAPAGYQNEIPPEGVSLITYESIHLHLRAWITEDPEDFKPRPAVVFLHSGYAFESKHWEQAAPFQEAGFVLMMPMLRGENDNPGNFEHLYGEVDDVVFAAHHLSTLPYVDPNRIYVVGHGAGAQLAVLVAMVRSRYKAAAAFSGALDYEAFVGDYAELMPYDIGVVEERRLRNPLAFVASLKIPLYLFVESSNLIARRSNAHLEAEAQELGMECHLELLAGDHYTMLPTAIEQTITLLKIRSGHGQRPPGQSSPLDYVW